MIIKSIGGFGFYLFCQVYATLKMCFLMPVAFLMFGILSLIDMNKILHKKCDGIYENENKIFDGLLNVIVNIL